MRISEITQNNKTYQDLLEIGSVLPEYHNLRGMYEMIVDSGDLPSRLMLLHLLQARGRSYQKLLRDVWPDEDDPDIIEYRKELQNICMDLQSMQQELKK